MWRDDLSVGEKQSHALAIDAGVVADGRQVLRALCVQGADQVFRHAAKSETADHDAGAIEHVANGLVRTWLRLYSWHPDSTFGGSSCNVASALATSNTRQTASRRTWSFSRAQFASSALDFCETFSDWQFFS